MKKKIGIITFHRAHNYGAMLQGFALQQTLSEKYDSEIIDYRSRCIENFYYSPLRIKSMIKSLILRKEKISNLNLKIHRKKSFDQFFDEFLIKSESYNIDNISECSKKYDKIITGSDQVWNAHMVQNDLNYFLQFAEPSKRLSYAASFGNNSILSHTQKQKMADLISSINIPLIRESEGFEILKQLGVKNFDKAKLVCDPIFLLTKQEWEDKLQLLKKDGNYIFAFFVNDPINSLPVVRELHEKTGFPVKYCHSYGLEKDIPNWCEDYMDIGPKEFLEILNNAKYVVTTSFHGMAFSIRLNKQFYYELNKNATNGRLNTLADIFDLHDREITEDRIPSLATIDYDNVNNTLNEYFMNSKNILFERIEGKPHE